MKQQYEGGEVTKGACGLIPQTRAVILIQIDIIIIIIQKHDHHHYDDDDDTGKTRSARAGWFTQMSSHDRCWTLDFNCMLVIITVIIMVLMVVMVITSTIVTLIINTILIILTMSFLSKPFAASTD